MTVSTGPIPLIELLRNSIGTAKVSDLAPDLVEASHDFLRPWRGSPRILPPTVQPIAVVRPQETDDVRKTVKFAIEHELPLVELGGGTGLMGGARTVRPGLVLDLRSMYRILEVNREDRTVRAQSGAVLEDVDAALRA